MPDPKQLPYLLNLLDDESKMVQDSVLSELKAFGPSLQNELTRLPQSPSRKQQELLKRLLEASSRDRLQEMWPGWFTIENSYDKLETALSLLCEFQVGAGSCGGLKVLLDGLAEEYKTRYDSAHPHQLAQFLFQEKALRGTQSDYYNPQNSNLVYVIEKKRGIPISLSAVYMLVGARLGLRIEGRNMPGHFLACFQSYDKKILVDCFNGGRVIHKEEMALLDISYSQNIDDLMDKEATAEAIIRRFLNNLIIAYRRKKERQNSRLMKELLKMQEKYFNGNIKFTDADLQKLSRGPLFNMGQLVRHSRYGYRGVVVDFDFSCQADDDWYYSNETQPSKDQCWYHILVDKTQRITYVAQSNLHADTRGEEIKHPLTAHFFGKFKEGRYVRNGKRWPKT